MGIKTLSGWITSSTFLIVCLISGSVLVGNCGRDDSSGEKRDPKSLLSDSDLTILSLPPQIDSIKIVEVIGVPDSITDWKTRDPYPHRAFSVWHYQSDRLYLDSMLTLHGVEIRRSGVRTARGLMVGDSLMRIRDLYGLSKDDFGLPYAALRFSLSEKDNMGMIIELDSNRVASVYVGRFF